MATGEGSRPRATLWVVDPSVSTAEDQGVGEVLRDWPGDSRVLHPALVRAEGPGEESGYDADGIVVLGSASSVHDGLDWAARLGRWLQPIVDGRRKIPLLGICYGHQLIAHLAGGTVEFMDAGHAKRSGVETSVLESGGLLPGRQELRVVVSHREHVARAPRGYRVVATRAGCPIDGIEHERLPIYGFQFHPEAREEFAARAGIDAGAIDARLREDSGRLLQAFRSRVLATR